MKILERKKGLTVPKVWPPPVLHVRVGVREVRNFLLSIYIKVFHEKIEILEKNLQDIFLLFFKTALWVCEK